MKKTILAVIALAAAALAAWRGVDYARARRYARQPFEVERFETPTFSVEIPKGWRRPNYQDPRETLTEFATSASTATVKEDDPYFVYGRLSVTDEGRNASTDRVIADWRKDGTAGSIRRVKLGSVEAQAWTDVVGAIDVAGQSRTFVFTAPNGHLYTAFYMRALGAFGMRQDYVFGRILASMKFHEERTPKGGPAPASR